MNRMQNHSKTQVVTLNLSDAFVKYLDRLCEKNLINSRSEAVREAIDNFLQKEESFLATVKHAEMD
jgi:metal-responsive CopG/Arc/MetJ family transcriptional regulator